MGWGSLSDRSRRRIERDTGLDVVSALGNGSSYFNLIVRPPSGQEHEHWSYSKRDRTAVKVHQTWHFTTCPQDYEKRA